MIFMTAIIVEPPPQPIRELNRPRKRTFRKHLETSDKKYSTYLTIGGRSTLVVYMTGIPSTRQDHQRHWISLKINDFLEILGFHGFQGSP